MTEQTAQTLKRLHDLEEQAILKAGQTLDRTTQLLEGRRKVAIGAGWFVLARDHSDFMQATALNRAGHHLRQAQRVIERELSGGDQ